MPMLTVKLGRSFICNWPHVLKETEAGTGVDQTPKFINIFRLIAMSIDLDLSRLFEEVDTEKQKTTLGSKHTINETIEKIKAAAECMRLSAERKGTNAPYQDD